jgi:amino acid permease
MMLSMYMSLVRDIWTPLIQSHLPEASPFLVMFWLQILLIPAFWQLSFQSLWFPVYIAIMGLIATFAILCFKANNYSIIADPDDASSDGRGLTDTLSGLNVLLLNTVASFNILYIQSGLRAPSLSRMQRLTRQGVLFATLVSVAIGVAGYRFFGVAVNDSGDEQAYPANFLDHHALKQSHHHAISQACDAHHFNPVPRQFVGINSNVDSGWTVPRL